MDEKELLEKAEAFGIKDYGGKCSTSVKKMKFVTTLVTQETVDEFNKEINECGFFDDYDKKKIKAHFSNFLTVYALGKELHKKKV